MKKPLILKVITLLFISTIFFYSCGNEDEPQLAPAKFNVDVAVVDFGDVEISNQKDFKITITNSGEQDLILKSYTISGTDANEFSVSETKKIVSTKQNTNVTITFKPTTEAVKNATLTIISSIGEHTITLKGKGTPKPLPVFSITPQNKNFGDIEVNTAISQTFKITNKGNADLVISGISLSNTTDFNSTAINTTITANDFYEFSIEFKPTTEGNKTSVLNFTTNIGDFLVNVEGNGTPKPKAVFSITPSSKNFGNVEVNKAISQTFTISNTGNADLVISDISIVNTTDFSTNATNQTISSNNSYEFSVTFSPQNEGSKTTIIKFTTNIGEYIINLEGNAVASTIVNIPDNNFKAALLEHGKSITGNGISVIDINGDGEIQITEAEAYNGTIECESKAINDVTGIQAFINLKKLNISKNTISSLDVSKSISLEYLNCAVNKISILDVSKNINLTQLYCNWNRIKELNVSTNTKLTSLYCNNNSLIRLNLFNACYGMSFMHATNNSNLKCIKINSSFIPPASGWYKDTTASYSDNCQ